ncbi:uncharacterized protein LOC111881140 [Lactuca sativa]|uniref:uncharacterized protein LOC111881140 n=1 Tax=Lactuca sativa TaxID=4236 RepID=UPI000CD8E4DE|nr:uncharacterized protein LOC111881140 [Lactuca sativa]
MIKDKVFMFFKTKFDEPNKDRPWFHSDKVMKITDAQNVMLVSFFSRGGERRCVELCKEQSVYIKGRNIMESPLMHKLVFLEKYDDTHGCFFDKCISWIMACVSYAKVSVLVNGNPTKDFKPHRGVLQGDPLSSFLFIIATGGLLAVIFKAVEKGLYESVNLSKNGLNLSIFQYEDGVIFLGEWYKENALNHLRILRCFHIASDLKVNLSKSKVMGIWVLASMVKRVESICNNFFGMELWMTSKQPGLHGKKVLSCKKNGCLDIGSLHVFNLASLGK